MTVHQSDSIILKTYPLGEADRIVAFFSREHGKVRGVANGARRMKNRFGASLERTFAPEIEFVLERGLMEIAGPKLRLTQKGSFLVNGVDVLTVSLFVKATSEKNSIFNPSVLSKGSANSAAFFIAADMAALRRSSSLILTFASSGDFASL